MSRKDLDALFSAVRKEGRTALMPFMSAGLPAPETTIDMFTSMAEAGADAFEVGIPYSDPLMDGATIQAGNARALASGLNLARAFEIVAEVAGRTKKPVVVMTYSNPVFCLGPDRFAKRCAEAGAAGLIVADLPLEEAPIVQRAVESVGLGMVLFVAPTSTDQRLADVAAASPVFIYGVADLGVTGERRKASSKARELAERVHRVTEVPLAMGVGISTPEQARSIADVVDGVIVGSALVRRVLDATNAAEAAASLRTAVGELAGALR